MAADIPRVHRCATDEQCPCCAGGDGPRDHHSRRPRRADLPGKTRPGHKVGQELLPIGAARFKSRATVNRDNDPPSGEPLSIRTAWETAIRRARIDNFRFHDLRHSAASYLAMSGASLAEIAEVLGHKTLSMVKRYTHLSDTHTRSVVARMNQTIFGA